MGTIRLQLFPRTTKREPGFLKLEGQYTSAQLQRVKGNTTNQGISTGIQQVVVPFKVQKCLKLSRFLQFRKWCRFLWSQYCATPFRMCSWLPDIKSTYFPLETLLKKMDVSYFFTPVLLSVHVCKNMFLLAPDSLGKPVYAYSAKIPFLEGLWSKYFR